MMEITDCCQKMLIASKPVSPPNFMGSIHTFMRQANRHIGVKNVTSLKGSTNSILKYIFTHSFIISSTDKSRNAGMPKRTPTVSKMWNNFSIYRNVLQFLALSFWHCLPSPFLGHSLPNALHEATASYWVLGGASLMRGAVGHIVHSSHASSEQSSEGSTASSHTLSSRSYSA